MKSIRMQVLGVFGGGVASPEEEALAERVGAVAAGCDWVVLTGGGRGVMAAASRGAVEAGGLTMAILPNAYPDGGYPNHWVHLPVFTGVGSARNSFNVLTASLCVAIGGGPGTLSEIALALKNSVPVWCWRSWSVNDPKGGVPAGLRVFDDENELIKALEDALVQTGEGLRVIVSVTAAVSATVIGPGHGYEYGYGALIVEQASSLLGERVPGGVVVSVVTLDAGLLTRIRLDGGSESASPDQRGQRRRPGEQ